MIVLEIAGNRRGRDEGRVASSRERALVDRRRHLVLHSGVDDADGHFVAAYGIDAAA